VDASGTSAAPKLTQGVRFDVRRATNSVGVSVRDAACYVLWSLARVHEVATLAPYALLVARILVVRATLDREVSIRRAASAAFQEWVGRTSLVPHGIAILRITDFAAVGNQRRAFIECAPCVAACVCASCATNTGTTNTVTLSSHTWSVCAYRTGTRKCVN